MCESHSVGAHQQPLSGVPNAVRGTRVALIKAEGCAEYHEARGAHLEREAEGRLTVSGDPLGKIGEKTLRACPEVPECPPFKGGGTCHEGDLEDTHWGTELSLS